MMSLTELGKAAISRVLCGNADPHADPFQTEHGRTYMRFDSLEFQNGPPDEFGLPTKDITFSYDGVRLYTMTIPNVGPHDTVTLSGITGRMGVSLE